MNEVQASQLIETIKELKGNNILDIVFNIVIPMSVLILTSIITLHINKRQNEFQLRQQQIALKKEFKVKALHNIRINIINLTRTFAKFNLDFNYFLREKIALSDLIKYLNKVEKEYRISVSSINSEKCLVTDYKIYMDSINERLIKISNTIYYKICFPDKNIPQVLKGTVVDIKDISAISNMIEELINESVNISNILENKINETIESII
ncbi:hypothetical protein FDC58_15655 [Clostridium botulinum]|nr:hypothetical protein [Clostridium botulinum]NFP30632.1 hypothetical protein [Clostridium botulinum]